MSDIDDPRLSALYRQAPAGEPEPRSDALIVEAANKAVRPAARRRYAAWAVAATLVLGVGIGWRVLPLGPTTAAPDFPQPAPAVEGAAAPPAEARPSPPAATRPAEADSDALNAAPFGSMPGDAAKRMDRRKESVIAAPAAEVAQGREVSSIAPRVLDAESEAATGSECRGYWPDGEIAVDQWRTLIARARTRGDGEQLRCLEQRYRELFGDEAAAITKPALDK